MRPTFIPVKLKTGVTYHKVIYLWSESWEDTDDWFYVWEGNSFKPYHRVRVLSLDDKDVYPEYHFKEDSFRNYLDEFLNEIPLTPVIHNGYLGYLIGNFGNEYWVYKKTTNRVIVTPKPPKPVYLGAKKEVVREELRKYIIHGVYKRVSFANIHLDHLIVMTSKKLAKK